MASLLLLHLIFSIFHTINAQIHLSLQSPVVLPVNRDPLTLLYTTQINHGGEPKPEKLVIDLSAPFVSISCDSSVKLVPRRSIRCAIAKPFHFGETQFSSCDLSVVNGITGLKTRGELAEGLIAVGSNSGKLAQIADFLVACAPRAQLNGLPSGVQGVLGLGKSPIGFPSQIAARLELDHRKFALCLSPSDGFVSFDPISSSLTYTNLVNYPEVNPQDYFINVRSIKINGKRVALGEEGIGRTKLSTNVPYTLLESRIYSVFKRAYLKAADFMNLTRVASVAPFDLCFDSKGVDQNAIVVPGIDLVLQSEMVKWRVNSMVKLSSDVVCLGILDGGFDLGEKTSVVIGGFQLEETLLEFDLGKNMLGFSSVKQGSCSDFVPESRVKEFL